MMINFKKYKNQTWSKIINNNNKKKTKAETVSSIVIFIFLKVTFRGSAMDHITHT